MPRWWILFMLTVIPAALYAQEQPADTATFYKDLYRYSKDKKALYFLYRAIFNVPSDPVKAVPDKRNEKKGISKRLAGKTIRTISIITFEPFGASLNDTMSVPHSLLQKTGNALHVKSRLSMIRDYLLFEEGEPLDLLKIRETERLLRQSDFIRDVVIMAYPVPGNPGEVDVKVYARDLWTFEASVTLTTSKTRVRFTEYNFLGLGHRFRNKVEYDHNETQQSPLLWEGSYVLPNVENTYISTGIKYLFSTHDDQWGVFAERPFYSAETNWAGGILYDGRKLRDSVRLFNDPVQPFQYTSGSTGIWGGRSFRIKPGESSEERSTRLVLSAGYTRTRYIDLVTPDPEVASLFQPVDLYLASLGYSTRKYFIDRYIYDFGEREDVPTGRLLQFTGGYETKGPKGRIYSGVNFGASGYIGSGYLSAQTGFGTFFDQHKLTQSVINTELFAFSRLFKAGNWRIRWFGFAGLTYGINRLGNEKISFRRNEGLPGYKYAEPLGTSRFTCSVRALFFNPLEVMGFRFTPVIFAGIGLMEDNNRPLFKSTIYPGFGGGFAISNIHLIHSDFELLVGFYPVVPGTEQFKVRLNPVDFWSTTFTDYSFGRPGVMVFE